MEIHTVHHTQGIAFRGRDGTPKWSQAFQYPTAVDHIVSHFGTTNASSLKLIVGHLLLHALVGPPDWGLPNFECLVELFVNTMKQVAGEPCAGLEPSSFQLLKPDKHASFSTIT